MQVVLIALTILYTSSFLSVWLLNQYIPSWQQTVHPHTLQYWKSLGFNLNMHRGILVVGTMEMKRGSPPPSATLYLALRITWLHAHQQQAKSKWNGSFIWRENNMDFDLTDIYVVQSEGTVKNGNVGSHSTWWAPLQSVGLYF